MGLANLIGVENEILFWSVFTILFILAFLSYAGWKFWKLSGEKAKPVIESDE